MKEKVFFLGYIVSAGGVSIDPKKVRAVKNLPVPTDLQALRGFLELTSYYRKFVPSY